MVFAEANIVVRRINAQLAAETSLMQMALSTIPSMGVDVKFTKRAAAELTKQLKGMIDGEP